MKARDAHATKNVEIKTSKPGGTTKMNGRNVGNTTAISQMVRKHISNIILTTNAKLIEQEIQTSGFRKKTKTTVTAM